MSKGKGSKTKKSQPVKYKLEYDSNNSGGDWWLKDKDWAAMEKAGWTVEWGGLYFCNSEYGSFREYTPPVVDPPCPLPVPKEGSRFLDNPCPGHRYATSYAEAKEKGYRWLGALARGAWIETEDVKAEIEKWESLTRQDAAAEGCNCCGSPHGFSWTVLTGPHAGKPGYLMIERTSRWGVGDEEQEEGR